MHRNMLTAVFLCLLSLGLCSPVGPVGDSFPPLLDATLDDLRVGLDSGAFTSVDLVRAYMARINEVNDQLRAVNELNPDALQIATALDLERKTSGSSLGPLHGIPVLIKDNIGTADKMNNTAGSFALVGSKLKQDSTVANKLRKAGVVILGKTNLAQFAGMRSSLQSSGWSAYGGQTVGGYIPDQDPDGSSSGSGVASSLGLAWASLGTETAGSVCDPAHTNNLVGIKPTVGLTSRFCVVPISEHEDTVGPMARTVKDAAALLQAIAGVDKRDNYTSASPFGDDVPDYAAACKESGLQGKRLGVPAGFADWFNFPNSLPAIDAFEDMLDILRDAGAEIITGIHLPGWKAVKDGKDPSVARADFLTDLPRYLTQLETNPNNITNVEDLRDYVQSDPREMADVYDTKAWDEALKTGLYNTMPAFWGYYTDQLYNAGPLGMTGAIRNHSLDALVMPTMFMTMLASAVGAPVISVPAGKAPDGTPFVRNPANTLNWAGPNHPYGLGFGGDLFSEETLIEIAYAFEQKTLVRKKVHPIIKPKTELRDVVEGIGSEEL